MNVIGRLRNIVYKIEFAIENIRNYLAVKKYKKLYDDYEDDGNNCGSLKFIWGVTSWDDLSGRDANFYTMNDIDITYDRDSKEYMLGIETAFLFKNREAECNYLKNVLDAFTQFMDNNNYSKNYEYILFMGNPMTKLKAESIEELYINFKIFVEGYCSTYSQKSIKS